MIPAPGPSTGTGTGTPQPQPQQQQQDGQTHTNAATRITSPSAAPAAAATTPAPAPAPGAADEPPAASALALAQLLAPSSPASASSSLSLHTSTLALRAELAALHAEATAVHGAYDGPDAAASKENSEKVHGHGHRAPEKNNSGIGKTETEAQWALSAAPQHLAAAFPPPVPPFALPPLPPAVAAGSAYAAGSGGGLLRRRRTVYGADADADASDASSSSLSDEPDARASSYLRARHTAEASDESEDARVPGRWGLLTLEGSARGGEAHSTATVTSVLTPVAKTAMSPWGLHRETPSANGVIGVGADARDEPAVHPKLSPSERAKGKRAGKGKGTRGRWRSSLARER
ncbi:hypothetical protein DFH08DRAFT_1041803 [Mycena albidolilacea]|uniref:Uncharacterized protein n=1 Tax=Mycena albidolilacea TaxID=1033008 RepID=A0AAD6ZAV4_9AGAR|nr:hypothetical protein DFH08DRAFT_1041803 [Mycena albidolilacea]